jgi:hypothetical protein
MMRYRLPSGGGLILTAALQAGYKAVEPSGRRRKSGYPYTKFLANA